MNGPQYIRFAPQVLDLANYCKHPGPISPDSEDPSIKKGIHFSPFTSKCDFYYNLESVLEKRQDLLNLASSLDWLPTNSPERYMGQIPYSYMHLPILNNAPPTAPCYKSLYVAEHFLNLLNISGLGQIKQKEVSKNQWTTTCIISDLVSYNAAMEKEFGLPPITMPAGLQEKLDKLHNKPTAPVREPADF